MNRANNLKTWCTWERCLYRVGSVAANSNGNENRREQFKRAVFPYCSPTFTRTPGLLSMRNIVEHSTTHCTIITMELAIFLRSRAIFHFKQLTIRLKWTNSTIDRYERYHIIYSLCRSKFFLVWIHRKDKGFSRSGFLVCSQRSVRKGNPFCLLFLPIFVLWSQSRYRLFIRKSFQFEYTLWLLGFFNNNG